jgi:hypothetical protein
LLKLRRRIIQVIEQVDNPAPTAVGKSVHAQLDRPLVPNGL